MQERLSTPKDTFSKLPAAKRLKIEAALVREFAASGYQRASLNTVVKGLGIAKGSLYQYFANKEAIFLYIFERFTRMVKDMVQGQTPPEPGQGLWEAVRGTFLAGIAFIDRYPDYYRLYLTVLFEHEVPRREELISRVRLFSREYFGPLISQGQEEGTVALVPVAVVVFVIDAVLDRFLQGYARSYLDGGLGLAAKDRLALEAEVGLLIDSLKHGFMCCPPLP